LASVLSAFFWESRASAGAVSSENPTGKGQAIRVPNPPLERADLDVKAIALTKYQTILM
jgi:hypothetical protein